MERLQTRLERDPAPIDLLATKHRLLNEWEGVEYGTSPLRYNRELLAPARIVRRDSHGDPATSSDDVQQLAGWRYVATTNSGERILDTFLTPRLGQLVKPFPGAEIYSGDNRSDFIDVGTLCIKVDPFIPELLVDSPWMQEYDCERSAVISMERFGVRNLSNVGRPGFIMPEIGRHPKVAKTSFLREFMLGMRQLRAAGYTTIFGFPTDTRRARAYQSLGMTLKGAQRKRAFVVDLRTWPRLQRYPVAEKV